MSTRFQRPSGSYSGATGLSNRTKYQTDSGATPKVAISSAKVDGDINYVIDAVNTLDDSISSLVAGSIPDGSITTAKLADTSVTSAKIASGVDRTKLASGTANRLVGNDSSGVITDITVGSELTVSSSSLTITSAGITSSKLAAGSVDGSKFTNQSANTFLAGPSSGAATAPTFRGITVTDLPSVAFNHVATYTTAGTFSFTPAANVTKVWVEVWGGGGGGGGVSAAGNATGAGGGGGGYACGFITVTPSVSHTVTVGASGTAGANTGGTGGTGGTSSFAGASVTISATGGQGGSGAAAYNTAYFGGTAGSGLNGDINITGEQGAASASNSGTGTIHGGSGGACPRGGFGGAEVYASFGSTSNGNNGTNPGGGGGGGGGASKSGGAGGVGMVAIYYP